MIEVDSVYHLSCSKNGVVFGAGITKGSEGTTSMGERIQAGKFPVLFYGNKQQEYNQRVKRSKTQNSKILRRVSVLQSLLASKTPCTNQGKSQSDSK